MPSCIKILRNLALVRDLESITSQIIRQLPELLPMFSVCLVCVPCFPTGSKFRDYSSKPAALISRDEKPACERKPDRSDRSDRSDRFLKEIGLKVLVYLVWVFEPLTNKLRS